MKKLLAFGLVSLSTLAACSEIPPQAYANRGDPESLLAVSTEVVNLDLSAQAIPQLADMVVQDPPTRAELHCLSTDSLCKKAHALFERHGIATQTTGGGHGVTLVYDRVEAHDCENRYIDNSINPYNLPPPTFGCSVAADTVQMVSDKHQFTNPSLMDFQDGEKAASTYEHYLKPESTSKQQQSPNWTITSGAGSQ